MTRLLGRPVGIGSVLAAMVLVVLDGTMVNIAVPTIAASMRVMPAQALQVITAYQCALLMALLPCAALGESHGYRRVFTSGVVLFTGASVLCALAPSLAWLVAARFLQGLGGAAIMALGIALLRAIVTPGQLGAAIGWNALAVALSSALGPAIGAGVLAWTSWPWLFAVNCPLGLLVVLSTRALPAGGGTAKPPDTVSIGLNAATFGAFVMGAQLAPSRPGVAVSVLAASALALLALVRREASKQAPLIPVDLLQIGAFRVSVLASVCCFAGQTAGLVALPFYLQHRLGQDALSAGLYMMPWPLTVALAAPWAGRLTQRVSTPRLCRAGGLFLATGLGAAALLPLTRAPLMLVPLTMLCGLGFGLFNVANNRQMFMAAPETRSGAAGGLQGSARLFGQTLGALIMTLLYTLGPADSAPLLGLGIGAVCALLAALASMRKT